MSAWFYPKAKALIKFLIKFWIIMPLAASVVLAIIMIVSVAPPMLVQYPYQLSISPWLNNTQQTSQHFGIPFPTYQFSSWAGGGVSLYWGPAPATDSVIQQNYITSASLLYPSMGYANWCGSANTSTTSIDTSHYGAGNIYSPSMALLVIKYHTPYFLQEPLDGYGACKGWAKDVVAAHPSLKTWNDSAQDATPQGFVRVDDIQFSVQIYNDLVNIYHNLVNTDPRLISYWQGIEVSSIGSDHGAYPKLGSGLPTFNGGYMYGSNTIYNFATSPLCTSSGCSSLAQAALSVNNGTSLQLISQLSQFADDFDVYSNVELLLGLSYAAYNFSQNYLGGRPFVVVPTQSVWVPPSQYPYPYNTSYIKGLNLLQLEELGVAGYVENGNQATALTVNRDLQLCSSLSPFGNEGLFLTSTVTSQTYFYSYIMNTFYYEAYCANTAVMQPGNVRYGDTTDPSFMAMVQYGTILNRMRNVGIISVQSPAVSASDPSTGVKIIKGNQIALAWFYTNKSSTEHASAILDASSLGITSSWMAISALDWKVLATGSGSSISLSVSIPARGWNPVYILPQVPNLQPVYSNLPITSYSLSSNTANYTTSAPHDFSGWMIISIDQVPSSVYTSNLGFLPSFSSLAAINSSFIGMEYVNGNFQNMTQAGWYYDNVNHLLYIHYLADDSVTLSINMGSSLQSGKIYITLSSSYLNVLAGSNSSLLATVTAYGQSSENVTLYANQLPDGISATFYPSTGQTNFTSKLFVYVSPSMMPGNYTFFVGASSLGQTAYAQLTISVSNQNSNKSSGVKSNTPVTYTLTISSAPAGFGSTLPASGVYLVNAGSSVNITAKPSQGWQLAGWYVNGNYAGNGSVISLIVTSDTTVFALFALSNKTEQTFTVSIYSDVKDQNVSVDGYNYRLPVSFAWSVNSMHSIAVPSFSQGDNGERYIFKGWMGSITSTNTSVKFVLNDDMSLLADYMSQSFVRLNFKDMQGSSIIPSYAILSSPQGMIMLNGSYGFWASNGITYKLIGANWDGTGVIGISNSNETFTVNEPTNITILLKIMPAIIKVQDIFGQPIQGAQVVIMLPNGINSVQTTNSSGYVYFTQVPEGEFSGKITYLGNSYSIAIQPGTIEYVTLVLSYPFIGSTAAASTAIGLALSYNHIKRKIRDIFTKENKE